MRERDECQRVHISAFCTIGSLIQVLYCPLKCGLELLGKPRSESTASRSLLRSKLSAQAGWDKLSLVFITCHHTGQA